MQQTLLIGRGISKKRSTQDKKTKTRDEKMYATVEDSNAKYARMRSKSLTSEENLDAGTARRVALFLSDVLTARMSSVRVEQCFGYASRTEWVDAAANHLEIFRLHNLHRPRCTAPLSFSARLPSSASMLELTDKGWRRTDSREGGFPSFSSCLLG